MDTVLAGQLFGEQSHPPDEVGIIFLEVINGSNVLVGNNENMHRRCRTGIQKGSQPFITIDHFAIGLTSDDAAENTILFH